MCDEGLKKAFQIYEIQLSSLLEAELEGILPALGQVGFLDIELRETLLGANLTPFKSVQHILLKLHKTNAYKAFLNALKKSSRSRLQNLARLIESSALEVSLPLGESETNQNSEPLSTPQQAEDTCCRSLVVNNPSLGRGKVFLVEDAKCTVTSTGSDNTVSLPLNKRGSQDDWSLTTRWSQIRYTEDDFGSCTDGECEEFKELYSYLHGLRLRGASPTHGHPHKKFATGVLKNKVRMEVYNFFLEKLLLDSLGAKEQIMSMFKANRDGMPLDLKVVAVNAGLDSYSGSDTSFTLLYDILSMNERGLCADYEIVSTTVHSQIACMHAHAGNVSQARYHILTALQHSANICDLAVLPTLWFHGWILFLEHGGKKDTIPDAVVKDIDQVYSQCMSMFRVLPAWYSICRKNSLAMGKADIHLRIAKDKISRGATAEDPQVYQILQRAKDTLNVVDRRILFQGNNVARIGFHNQLWFTLHHLGGNREKATTYMHPAVEYWIKSDTPVGYKLAKEVAEMANDADLIKHVEEASETYRIQMAEKQVSSSKT